MSWHPARIEYLCRFKDCGEPLHDFLLCMPGKVHCHEEAHPVRPNSIYRELRKEAGLYVRHVHLCTGMHRCTFCQIRCQGHDIVVNRSLVTSIDQKKLERLSCRLVSGMPGAINDCSIPPSWSNFLINVLSVTVGVVQGTLPQAYLHSVRYVKVVVWNFLPHSSGAALAPI